MFNTIHFTWITTNKVLCKVWSGDIFLEILCLMQIICPETCLWQMYPWLKQWVPVYVFEHKNPATCGICSTHTSQTAAEQVRVYLVCLFLAWPLSSWERPSLQCIGFACETIANNSLLKIDPSVVSQKYSAIQTSGCTWPAWSWWPVLVWVSASESMMKGRQGGLN